MKWSQTATWITVAVLSVGYWVLESQGSLQRAVLVVALSSSCFLVGSIAGFLISSYGEETATVGKIRDWLIGGITGLTIASVASIKAVLLTFAAGPGPQEFSLTVGTSITFAGLGFFFMFFQRELILNVLLAQSRINRGKIDGTSNAGLVAQRLVTLLPPSILSGVDDIEELIQDNDSEAEEFRSQLYSDEVSKFLDEAKAAAKLGRPLDWDVVSKVAILHYYRIYFEKGQAKESQQKKAEEWLNRTLVMNPNHADIRAKYADVLSMMERYEDAVATIEALAKSTDGPAYTLQWLGYFLLFVDGREDDAIKLSKEYAHRFPFLDHAYFNVACAYAQLHGKRLQESKTAASFEPEETISIDDYKNEAIDWLRKGLTIDPEYAEEIDEDQLGLGGSFASLAKDLDFRRSLAKGLIDAARKHGQSYEKDIRNPGGDKTPAALSRKRLLKLLKDAVVLDAETVRDELNPTLSPDGFALLRNDPDFVSFFDGLIRPNPPS
jgi:tetratricopeptide (TPR) repeat protein